MKRYLLLLCIVILFTGCGISERKDNNAKSMLTKTGELELEYATQFSVDYYEKNYVHISVADGSNYILVPENEEENSLGVENPVYIHRPCNSIYLAASSAMDLFLELNELNSIAACSTQSKDYAMEEVRDAIDFGNITYVGKYSAPDYELLLEKNCNLAIESTMISHSPKIKEQLERVHIPVFVERSSYEEDPIGRLEWIKLYGILTGKENEATKYFNNELKKIKDIIEANKTEQQSNIKKSVAFFSITSTGYVTVRKPGDYICKMIEMTGGEYSLNNILIEEENALSTINIGMEDFYREAQNADILIYNGSIDGGVNNINDLIAKNSLLKEFRAVKEGNVWSTSLNMFQESSKIAGVIVEMSDVISGKKMQGNYLKHLD